MRVMSILGYCDILTFERCNIMLQLWFIVVEIHWFWIYLCRTSLIGDLPFSNLTNFRPAFVELDLLWAYVCRTWFILEPHLVYWTHPHLSNFTHFGITFVELDSFLVYIFRTWQILDLQLSNLMHCERTFFELASFESTFFELDLQCSLV